MATPHDTVLNARITAMEYLARHFCQGAPVRLYGNFSATGRLSNNAQGFWALRETSSSCGRAYADRLTKVQQDVKMFMTRSDFDALEDFLIRQKAAACERELREIKESLRALEGAENGTDALEEESSPPLPTPSPHPFSIEILSINTPDRMLVAKSPTLPFILKYHPHTQRYQLIERYCGHLDCAIEEKLSHYYLEPAEILYAAWAPGMLHVHTETRESGRKRQGKGDYCNLEMKDVEGLEALMEDLIERGVCVQKVRVSVLGSLLLDG